MSQVSSLLSTKMHLKAKMKRVDEDVELTDDELDEGDVSVPQVGSETGV